MNANLNAAPQERRAAVARRWTWPDQSHYSTADRFAEPYTRLEADGGRDASSRRDGTAPLRRDVEVVR